MEVIPACKPLAVFDSRNTKHQECLSQYYCQYMKKENFFFISAPLMIEDSIAIGEIS
jgi:hypothetical protein